LKLLGEGTEQFEDLLRQALPDARIARMDRDTIRRKGAHESLLRRFERKEIDVIVGTQMIAKGHDFPEVTLVGVLSADQSLGLPDFRASERTFQLLTQVAGRAGRGEKPGVVVIQAFAVNHPVLQLAAAQDYEAFFTREMHYRRALRYPPMSALVQILVLDRSELKAQRWAARMAETLREEGRERLMISGPGPAPMERLKGVHRQQILVRSAGRRRLVQAVDRVLGRVEGEIPRRSISVDVDPLSLM
jgi:primosomal protein N' (replication factor Y)